MDGSPALGPPASISSTRCVGLALSRLASTQPDDPAPMTTKSNSDDCVPTLVRAVAVAITPAPTVLMNSRRFTPGTPTTPADARAHAPGRAGRASRTSQG